MLDGNWTGDHEKKTLDADMGGLDDNIPRDRLLQNIRVQGVLLLVQNEHHISKLVLEQILDPRNERR